MRITLMCVSAVALVLSGVACKKSAEQAATDICNHKSKCEKEEAPTADDIKECQESLADKDCGAAARAMTECMIAKETCTPEGKTDGEAMFGACAEPFGSYMECMKKKEGGNP